jgi:hypothetical protein
MVVKIIILVPITLTSREVLRHTHTHIHSSNYNLNHHYNSKIRKIITLNIFENVYGRLSWLLSTKNMVGKKMQKP